MEHSKRATHFSDRVASILRTPDEALAKRRLRNNYASQNNGRPIPPADARRFAVRQRQGRSSTLFGRIKLERGERPLAGFAELTQEIAQAKGLDIGELKIAI
jgi:hypothetical protein